MSERIDMQELKAKALAAKKSAMDMALFQSVASPSTILALIEIVRVAQATTLNYDRINPMRTADFHGEHCSCFRCSIDRLRTALEGVKK